MVVQAGKTIAMTKDLITETILRENSILVVIQTTLKGRRDVAVKVWIDLEVVTSEMEVSMFQRDIDMRVREAVVIGVAAGVWIDLEIVLQVIDAMTRDVAVGVWIDPESRRLVKAMVKEVGVGVWIGPETVTRGLAVGALHPVVGVGKEVRRKDGARGTEMTGRREGIEMTIETNTRNITRALHGKDPVGKVIERNHSEETPDPGRDPVGESATLNYLDPWIELFIQYNY